YLLRTAPSARLLVTATARREELDEGHPLADLATGLHALGRFTEIGLGRLGRDDTALLAKRITGAPLDAAGLERLYGDSEGNPLFVVEALQPDAPAAPKVQAVIAGRLARLSPPAAALAGVAAAIGRAFTADVLAAGTGLNDQVFVSALDELWRRGSSARTAPAHTTSAMAGSVMPPMPRSARRADARHIWRSPRRSNGARMLPRRCSRCTTRTPARPPRPSAGTSGRRKPPNGSTPTPKRSTRWSGRWRGPRTCRRDRTPPSSSSGCSPRCPRRCWPWRATRPSGYTRCIRAPCSSPASSAASLSRRCSGRWPWVLSPAATGGAAAASASGCGRAPSAMMTRSCGWRVTTSRESPPTGPAPLPT